MIAVALHELGIRMSTLTVGFGEFDNADLKIAKRTWHALGSRDEHITVRVERTVEELERHTSECIEFAGGVLETTVEVTLLTWAALRRAKELGFTDVIVGCEAGAMWGCNRSALASRKESMRRWRSDRLATLHDIECGWPLSANAAARHYASSLGITWRDPFVDPDLVRFHLPLDFKSLNAGRGEKGGAFRAFPLLKQLRPQRHSMQSCAGVQRFAEIAAKEKGFKSPLAWYNRIARDVGIDIHGDLRHLERFMQPLDHKFASFVHEQIQELNAAGLTHYLPDCLYDAGTIAARVGNI